MKPCDSRTCKDRLNSKKFPIVPHADANYNIICIEVNACGNQTKGHSGVTDIKHMRLFLPHGDTNAMDLEAIQKWIKKYKHCPYVNVTAKIEMVKETPKEHHYTLSWYTILRRCNGCELETSREILDPVFEKLAPHVWELTQFVIN